MTYNIYLEIQKKKKTHKNHQNNLEQQEKDG